MSKKTRPVTPIFARETLTTPFSSVVTPASKSDMVWMYVYMSTGHRGRVTVVDGVCVAVCDCEEERCMAEGKELRLPF